MSESIHQILDKIKSHLSNGEWILAGQLVSSVENEDSITNDQQLQISLIKSQLFIENKQLNKAEPLVNQMINGIANWQKSVQTQILHIASQYALSAKNSQLLDVYTTKFMALYESMSPVLQEKSKGLYADVLDITGQIAFTSQNYNEAMTIFESVVKIQRKVNRPLQLAISMFHAGKVANVLQLPNRAEVYLEESYRMFKDLKYIEGQLFVANSFIDTYQLKGDSQSVKTFQLISSELNQKLKYHDISRQKISESDALMDENKELRQKAVNLQIRLDSKDLEIVDLKHQISILEEKIDDFKDIKIVYENLKNQIKLLEGKITEQDSTINEQADLIKSQHNQIIKLKGQGEEEIDDAKLTLNELVESSRMVENIYTRLNEVKRVKIRILAMQLRVSSSKCIEAVKQLEKIDAVEIDSWDFSSPTVSIKE